ncbi:MAG: hypothetical protein ACR2PK_09755, partial [Acidimicrobiales bacterium]
MRFNPRALIGLCLVVLLLATGTAAAQTEDPPVDPPAGDDGGPAEEPAPEPEPEPEPEPTPEPTPAEDEELPDGETEESTAEKPKKKKGKNQPLPECEPEPPKPKKKGGGKDTAETQQGEGAAAETEECVPPRCDDNEIDLAPEEDEPNCIDPARLNRLIADFEAAAAEEAAALEELGVALEVLERLNAQLDALRVRLGEVQL